MGKLTDYKLDEDYLRKFGLTLDEDDKDSDIAILIDEAYEAVLDYVFMSNDELDHTQQAICDHLEDDTDGDSEDKIEGFKRSQLLVARNMLSSLVNPIDQPTIACLSGRCGLIKRNGFQKN
jgi:hypothetical protein